MPKSKEQIREEVAAKIKRFYELKDSVGLADYAEELWTKFLPTVGMENENNAEVTAFAEEFTKLLQTVPPKKGAKFAFDIRDEFIKRKINNTVAAAPVFAEYEAKIKNHEIPEAELYRDNPEAVEKIAAIATKGSKVFNIVKADEAIGFIISDCMRAVELDENGKIIDTGFSEASEDEMNSRPSMLEIGTMAWDNCGLDEDIKKKVQKRLDGNANDPTRDFGFEPNEYYVEGSPTFGVVPKEAQEYMKRPNDKLLGRIDEIEQAQRTDELVKNDGDTYVDFYDTAEKLGAILDIHLKINVPLRTAGFDDDFKKQLDSGLVSIVKNHTDKEKLKDMTPADLLNNINKSIEALKKNSEAYRASFEQANKESIDALKRKVKNNGSSVAEASAKNYEDYEKIAENFNKLAALCDNFVSFFETYKADLEKFYNKSVQDLKDEPFSKHIDRKRDERSKLFESNKDKKARETLESLRLKEELDIRNKAKLTEEQVYKQLSDDLSFAGDKNPKMIFAVDHLTEQKLFADGTKGSKARDTAIDKFLTDLSEGSPFLNKNIGFVNNLAKKLNELEAELKGGFDQKVKEFKDDIIAGKVPGVYAKHDVMAEAIASDLVYHTTPEGKMLKAVNETKKQVFNTLADSNEWKGYLKNHPEIGKAYKVPFDKDMSPNIGKEAERFGFKVSDDITKQISGTSFEKMPYDASRIITANKTELERLRNSYLGRLGDIDLYDGAIGNIAKNARAMLESLDKTKKAGHQDSPSYKNMVADLKKIADLDGEKRLQISTDEVDKLLENVEKSSAKYESEHSGFSNMFSGNTKGFGKNRLNVSKMAQSFSKTARNTLDKFKGTIDPTRTIQSLKTEFLDNVSAIDKTAISKGYGAFIRNSEASPAERLSRLINNANDLNRGSGSEFYNNAVSAAYSLQDAYKSGDAKKIEEAGQTLKDRVNDYLDYKKEQIFNGSSPNERGQQRIDAMIALHQAGGSATFYAKNQMAVDSDRMNLVNYNTSVEQDKNAVLESTAKQQEQILFENRNVEETNEKLDKAGLNKNIEQTQISYNSRVNNKSLQGLDKVSANNAYNAMNNLMLLKDLDTLNKNHLAEAKQNIAELVLDKMVQLDHGNTLHKNLKGLNEEKLSEEAKTLSQSPAFKAAVPENINPSYIKKFLANYNGHGVMQVKNNIDKYRKAVKDINRNAQGSANNKQLENEHIKKGLANGIVNK